MPIKPLPPNDWPAEQPIVVPYEPPGPPLGASMSDESPLLGSSITLSVDASSEPTVSVTRPDGMVLTFIGVEADDGYEVNYVADVAGLHTWSARSGNRETFAQRFFVRTS